MGKSTRTTARACGGKRRHKTQAAATTHLQRLIAAGTWVGSMVAYRCPIGCGGWHVGHREHRKRGGR